MIVTTTLRSFTAQSQENPVTIGAWPTSMQPPQSTGFSWSMMNRPSSTALRRLFGTKGMKLPRPERARGLLLCSRRSSRN